MNLRLGAWILSSALAAMLASSPLAAVCVPSASTLCLLSNRIQVDIAWQNGLETDEGRVLPAMASDDFGFFSYDDADAAEVMIRALDACNTFGHYWVQWVSLSDFGQTITVTDTELANQKQYFVTEGTFSSPATDTMALPCSVPTIAPAFVEETLGVPSKGAAQLPLASSRFQVEVTWDTGMNSGPGQPVTLTDRSGYFWFFSASNPELLVKMVPDSNTGFYFFAAGAITNVDYQVRVVDTCSGDSQTYEQTGTPSTLVDEQAFPLACPLIFTDGFESGGLSMWSSSVGGP